MANFPTSKDDATSLPNPTGTNTQNNPDHAALHTAENAAIIAAETKIGTGASVPAANTLLFGTGAGTSAWTALTSAQLAAVLSDETGSGSAVFGNTPTLITPKVDTINESTPSNGVTVSGVNLKSGVITTAGYASSTALQTNAVQASQLATNAITLGYTEITANFSTASATAVQVTGLTVTVTIPAGTRRVKLSANLPNVTNTVGVTTAFCSIWDGTVGSGTQMVDEALGSTMAATNYFTGGIAQAIISPSAGSKTYNVALRSTAANNLTVTNGATVRSYILVEAI